jgi:hypothetical protein
VLKIDLIIIISNNRRITYFVSLAGDSNGQTIEPIREEVCAPAGSNITLSCTYSSAVSLQWYLQDPGSAPQYILLILHGVGSPSRAPGLDPRLSVKLNETWWLCIQTYV